MFSEAKVTEIYCMADDFPFDNQWQGRNSEFYVHSCKCGWQRTIEIREFPEEYQRKVLCRQRIYRPGIIENLFLNGIQLFTKVKDNMKNSLMSVADKILLRKRALIEMVNDELGIYLDETHPFFYIPMVIPLLFVYATIFPFFKLYNLMEISIFVPG